MKGRGSRSRRLGPWLLRSKLGLALLNRRRANGTHYSEVRRLRIRDRKMAYDLRDSRRENKLIIGCRVLINIDEGENEVRRKVYNEVLNEG